MNDYLKKLIAGKELTAKEAKNVADLLLSNSCTDVQSAAILSLLAAKGESIDEISGFIQSAREYMQKVDSIDAIDVCGTGGDGKFTFNISTAVAFVVAGAGVNVAKHGNRAVSSLSGSADVLEALGMNIHLTPEAAIKIFKKTGFVFFFAPLFHPSFKHIALVRKELGIPTIFNYLGPFLNPANTKKQLIGVPSKKIAYKLAEVARKLGYEHLLIVTSSDGMDEISISVITHVVEVKKNTITSFDIDPKEYSLTKSSLDALQTLEIKASADIISNILTSEKGARRDTVLLNSAAACYVAGKVLSLQEGIALARESIDSGSAKKVLENVVKESQKYA